MFIILTFTYFIISIVLVPGDPNKDCDLFVLDAVQVKSYDTALRSKELTRYIDQTDQGQEKGSIVIHISQIGN